MLGDRSKVYIITFLGPVGVGKSTQIRLLKDYLKSKNTRVVETFIKNSHVFAYILSRFLIALGACEKTSNPEGLVRIHARRDVVERLFPLWSFLDTLSIALKFLFTVYIPFFLGFTLLIEEGLLMTFQVYTMSFPRFFNTEPKVLPLLPRLLGWIMSKNHLNVVLDASDEELDRRRKNRIYRRYELLEYVSLQRKWIKSVCENFGDTIFIDTTEEPLVSVHRKIVTALEKRMVEKCV